MEGGGVVLREGSKLRLVDSTRSSSAVNFLEIFRNMSCYRHGPRIDLPNHTIIILLGCD
jgi:hypothetical protein